MSEATPEVLPEAASSGTAEAEARPNTEAPAGSDTDTRAETPPAASDSPPEAAGEPAATAQTENAAPATPQRGVLGRTPIPGSDPAGQPVSDEPEFEALRAEATRDPIQGLPDWERVVKLGEDILASKGKDFVAASYWAVGLAHEKSLPGLAEALATLDAMVQGFWNTGFPPAKRVKRRANAFSWMAERAGEMVDKLEPLSVHREAVEVCIESLTSVDESLSDKLGEVSVEWGQLLRALRTLRDRMPKEAPAEAPGAVSSPTSAPTSTASRPRPATTPSSAAGPSEITSKADAMQWISKCATYFREQEPKSPIAYRLMRITRWAEISAAPAAQDGKTHLLPPPPERVAGLRKLLDAGDWPTLFEAAEAAFRERPLWLDAQRYAAQALAGLGGPYHEVLESLQDELRALLRRAPELPGLSCKDGTPLADPDTREWLRNEVSAGDGGGGGGGGTQRDVDPAALDAARGDARQLARKGRLGEAIGKLEEALGPGDSPRNRFLAQLEIATLCAESGRERLALPLFEKLDTEIQRYGLEEWEPALSVEVLRALYRCRRKLADARDATPELKASADEVFGRLCRVDPVAAAAME